MDTTNELKNDLNLSERLAALKLVRKPTPKSSAPSSTHGDPRGNTGLLDSPIDIGRPLKKVVSEQPHIQRVRLEPFSIPEACYRTSQLLQSIVL